MPNWVYSTVEMEVNNSDLKLLEAVKENGGICRTYKPMPAVLKGTRSPVQIVSKKEYKEQQKFNEDYLNSIPEGEEHLDWKIKKGITQEMHDNLVDSYGYADWYGWANEHWGTKWGDCEFDYEINETTDNDSAIVVVRWESAWVPVGYAVIEKFLNDFRVVDTPAMFFWEEERGYGQEFLLVDGELSLTSEWDLPEWGDEDYQDDKGNYYAYLTEDYHKMGEVYKKGFYLEYSIYEPYNKEVHGEIKKVE